MKSLLDGHIVLSRANADRGHFPAIDVPRSVSRLASVAAPLDHQHLMKEAREALANYADARLLIDSGLYSPGGSAGIDKAIALHEPLMAFLQQPLKKAVSLEETRQALAACLRRTS